MKEMRILHFVTDSLADFERMSEKAAKAGATHVIISDMPRSRWMWERDLSDPYTNWSMGQCQIFKLVCPPELEKYLPVEHIRECFELVRERCEILKKHGLKPALFSNEPFWLPEEVYREHPGWRGARCDHPRRARKPYYSPSIDNPEVLEMYRKAVEKLVDATGIDFIHFKTNDCGGGISWSTGTYTGPNGPAEYQNRSMADRICGFLNAVQEGGKGITVSLESDIGLKEPEISIGSSWHNIRKNQILNKRDNTGKIVLSTNLNFDLSKQPVKKLPGVLKMLKDMCRIFQADTEVKMIEIPRSDLEEAMPCYQEALERKIQGIGDCYGVLEWIAEKLAGKEGAAHLVNAWSYLEDMEQHYKHAGIDLIIMGCLHQRWINRPFLLFPKELSEEEKKYYRDYQFQALSEKEAEDLMNLQGIEIVRGFTSAYLIRQTFGMVRGSLRAAVAELEKAGETESIRRTILRLQVLDCFYQNIVNAVDFQELVDRTDYEAEPPRSLRWPTRNDSRYEDFQRITRNEIDNAYRLAGLLEKDMESIILCDVPEKEDVFVFSTKLREQLIRKAEIMLDHMNDGMRVYESNNI